MSLRWYSHYMEDYDRDTRGLTMLQHGAYRMLLDECYRTERPLPAGLPVIHMIARAVTKGDKAAVSLVLNQFFSLGEDGWHNRRVDEELASANEIMETKSAAGKAGAAARWKDGRRNGRRNASANGKDDATAMANRCTSTPTNTDLETDVSKSKRCAPFVLPDWVPSPSWLDFLEMRKRIRKPPTDRAKTLLVLELRKLSDAGHDPTAVLENSTRNSWQDLYAPRERHVNGSTDRTNPHDTFLAGGIAALDKFKAT